MQMQMPPKNVPLEKSIQRSIRARLNGIGCWLQTNSPGQFGSYNRGRLDFTGIYRGMGFCLEVTRPGRGHTFEPSTLCPHCWKELTPTQRNELRAVRTAGGVAHVATSANEAEAIVKFWWNLRNR